MVVEDKMSLDSKDNPDEIPFEPADQPEGTEAWGAQNASHITDVKVRVPGDATAAPAASDDNNNHEAKLSAYLRRSWLPLLESPVDVKARRTDSVAMAWQRRR